MGRHHIAGRALLGAAAALIATAVVAAVPPGTPLTAEAAPAACGPLGLLVEYDLNDRCDFGSGLDPAQVGDVAVVAGLREAGLFALRVGCANRRPVPVAAVPDQVLVSAADPERLAFAVRIVSRRLADQVTGQTIRVNALTTIVLLRPGTLTRAFLLRTVPTLQGPGWSADLNYFEPALPNHGFRPGDDPKPSMGVTQGGGGGRSVLVVDSPSEKGAHPPAPDLVQSTFGVIDTEYDVDGNGLVDEDHGHGVFVASYIKRLAPKSAVVLAGVDGGQLPRVGRWSPMLFSDADLMATMGDAFGLSPSGQAVRRSFDLVNLSLGGSGCDGIAARLPLGRFMRDLAEVAFRQFEVRPRYVAAAGNDGADVKHFPAAWRDKATIEAAADAVDIALGGGPTPAGNEIRQIHSYLRVRMTAVGSWERGVRDGFSNCGTWVNGIAAGADRHSRYQSANSWASWSGTSFATARVTARLALGQGVTDVVVAPSAGAC